MRWQRNVTREERVLDEIRKYVADHGVPPVVEELAERIGCSLPTLHKYLVRLEEGGRIVSLWVSGRRSPRSIRIVESRQLAIDCPPRPST